MSVQNLYRFFSAHCVYSTRCKEQITQNSIPKNDDTVISWKEIKSNLTNAGEEAVGTCGKTRQII
jgi:hypothetical protein